MFWLAVGTQSINGRGRRLLVHVFVNVFDLPGQYHGLQLSISSLSMFLSMFLIYLDNITDFGRPSAPCPCFVNVLIYLDNIMDNIMDNITDNILADPPDTCANLPISPLPPTKNRPGIRRSGHQSSKTICCLLAEFCEVLDRSYHL